MSKIKNYRDRWAGTGGWVQPFQLSDTAKNEIKHLLRKYDEKTIEALTLKFESICKAQQVMEKSYAERPDYDSIIDQINHTEELATELSHHLSRWHVQAERFVSEYYFLNRQPGGGCEDFAELSKQLHTLSQACKAVELKRESRSLSKYTFFGVEIGNVLAANTTYAISDGHDSMLPRLLDVLLPEIGAEISGRAVAKSARKATEQKKARK